MKMPEKHDLLLSRHSHGKGTRHQGNPCVCNMALLPSADIMAVRLQKQ